MPGLSDPLYERAFDTLTSCWELADAKFVRNLFAGSKKLKPFVRIIPPQFQNLTDMATSCLGDWQQRQTNDGEAVLVLALRQLQKTYDKNDSMHDQLKLLADDIEAFLAAGGSAPPPLTPEMIRQAHPDGQPWTDVEEDRICLRCADAVAQVRVARVVNQVLQPAVVTGTAWLAAPTLALTCWHVVEGRSFFEQAITKADLDGQLASLVLRFGFDRVATGAEYALHQLEHHNPDLDYALLRLHDRREVPLDRHGFLWLDPEAPLTQVTELVLIQHPDGMPKKRGAGRWHKEAGSRLLYDVPTAGGSSGGPVLNRSNYRAVALHRGENQAHQLREGTLLRAILADLKAAKPDLVAEINQSQAPQEE
jgi:hypothetical protein